VNSQSAHNLSESIPPFNNLKDIALVGNGGVATVSCEGDGRSGFAFIAVSQVAIVNITFTSCSEVRNSTSRNFSSADILLDQFLVGLYFYACRDVAMSNVTVDSSVNATGVVMYDTTGINVIQYSVFANNSVQMGVSGGGGFYVEFSYCVPGNGKCSQSTISNSDALYTFDNCIFANNNASGSSNNNSVYILPYHADHQAFGRGGGLSIFMKGNASNNTFSITNCHFESNSAEWGGGLFVEFQDETANNSISVTHCTLERNMCNYTLTGGTGGGGMRIGHYVYNQYENRAGNTIKVVQCHFNGNYAMYGGGISLSPTLQDTHGPNNGTAVVELTGLWFTGNTGKIGAALHVGLFTLITRGFMLGVFVRNCFFHNNSAHWADLIKMSDKPHTIGAGAVYIFQVPVTFQELNEFYNNSGTALVVTGGHVDMTDTEIFFINNTGYRGGAISLLGSTYILVNNTQLNFSGNVAINEGGAIYNKYVEMDNLMSQTNCFIRYSNASQGPDDWDGASFWFHNNTDRNGHRINSIHTSSILPCARTGGDYYARKKRIFCWNGWTYDSPGNCCQEQITTEAGNITFTTPNNEIQVIPGKEFTIPLNVTNDYDSNLDNEIVFSYTANYGNVSKTGYFWGRSTTLVGKEGLNITVTLESVGDRIWHVQFVAKLMPCPPGLKPNASDAYNVKCVCSQTYQNNVWCSPDTLSVGMNDRHWIGQLEDSEEYYVGLCPLSFCNVSESSYVQLPNTSKNLSDYICSEYRTGVLCGMCVPGCGPVVNSPNLECVNCTTINLDANVAKYIASIYLPLALLFTVLILFDIRLTTGPANAFILYCQIVSSTFSLDADGQISMTRTVKNAGAPSKAYMVIYGVFNLEFFENLIPPFCFSSHFNTLSVLCLDYGVAFFPLAMIIVAVVCLKIKECSPFKVNSTVKKRNRRARKCLGCGTRSVNEALLPAFAAFILLSYTKFSLISSYIMSLQSVIDENGTEQEPQRVYFAGHLKSTDATYIHYLIPSTIVFVIFVCVTPLLLLTYPLNMLEWVLVRVNILWRFYPIDKIHLFLDTFQGCYKNKMRFFAGLYFLFRLSINASYIATDTWLEQFVVQQVACLIMVTLISLCKPYRIEFFNYVDILIFTNLAILNTLTLYLYAVSQQHLPPPFSAFVLQYILVFLPLLYMVSYIAWHFMTKRNQWTQKKLHRYESRISRAITSDADVTRTELKVDEEDQALFARAQVTNQYRHPQGRQVVAHNLPPSEVDTSNSTRSIKSHRSQLLTNVSNASHQNSGSRHGAASIGYGTISTNYSSRDGSKITGTSEETETRSTEDY
jgi:hypothetical protein